MVGLNSNEQHLNQPSQFGESFTAFLSKLLHRQQLYHGGCRACHIFSSVDVCSKCHSLLQGGEPDLMTAAKMVLFDWQQGKIPFFVPPPQQEDNTLEEPNVTGDTRDGEAKIETEEEKARALKAIADVISSQQLEDVPVQSDLYSENELNGEMSKQTVNPE